MPDCHIRSSPLLASTLALTFALLMVLLSHGTARADHSLVHWWPIQVKSYYGTYDATQKDPGHACGSLIGPTLEEWVPPAKANKPYTIGVAIPHLKDSYWLAMNYGIMDEARRLGLGVTLVQAGGYNMLSKQIEQVLQFQRQDLDGIILASIDYRACDSLVSVLKQRGLPVVEVINDIQAPAIAAKALVSFYDMGFYAGKFVADQAEEQARGEIRVGFLPGPQNSGWAPESLRGFKDAVSIFPGKSQIVDVQWGDTGATVQSARIRRMLSDHDRLDYIVGNAVAANEAPKILSELKRAAEVTVVSTYITPPLYDRIKRGEVAAAPSDLTVYQGRMAVNMLVRRLNGEIPGKDFPFRAGPIIPVITQHNLTEYPFEMLFGPRDYSPVQKINSASGHP